MNEIDLLRKLAIASKQEEVPPVDVTRSVISEIGYGEEDYVRPLAWVAACSFAVAIPVSILALQTLDRWTDPLINTFRLVAWVSP